MLQISLDHLYVISSDILCPLSNRRTNSECMIRRQNYKVVCHSSHSTVEWKDGNYKAKKHQRSQHLNIKSLLSQSYQTVQNIKYGQQTSRSAQFSSLPSYRVQRTANIKIRTVLFTAILQSPRIFQIIQTTLIQSLISLAACKLSDHLNRNMRKLTFWYVRPRKTQIYLRIRAFWSVLFAWRNLASLAIQNAPSKDSDQSARMRRLIWIFAGRAHVRRYVFWRGSSFWRCGPYVGYAFSFKVYWDAFQSESTLSWNVLTLLSSLLSKGYHSRRK